ncbi:MAG: GNAT family N-acetyltransferase [Thermoleophilia bacterium]|nr:GNAT family N-acetyltransferase [Thermoleophilia bacterium]
MSRAAHELPDAHTVVDVDPIRVAPRDEWNELVARLGGDDVYLRRGWHDSAALLEVDGTIPVLLHARLDGGEVALPLLLRPLPGDEAGFDATSCYGYGGPIATGAVDLDAFGAALDEWARANHVVTTFLRFQPTLGNHRWCPATAELIELGATVAWDVSADRDLMTTMHSHHRRAVRKAERAGVQVRIVEAPTTLDEFRAMYDHTMRRQDAAEFYFFPDDYWQALLDDAGGERVLVDALLGDDAEPVASLLCVAHGEWLHYHLGASADAARNIGASNACFLAAAQWAQARGLRGFHLGGGVGGGVESPLFTFKHRYDPLAEPLPFHIAKVVHDMEWYERLAGTSSTAGYFPPWRADA